MNYCIGENSNSIKLEVGDVIRDTHLKAGCKVKDVCGEHIHFSDISYTHPYEFMSFGFKLYENLRKTLGIKSIKFLTPSGNFKIDKNSNMAECYKRVLDIHNN